jgi:hypothetical protein
MNRRVRGVCSISECNRRHFGYGYCNAHYRRWKTYGDPNVTKRPVGLSFEERFLSYVQKTETCWLWTGHITRLGYARFAIGSASTPAHRVSYRLFKGDIPKGLTLDHLCRVRHCVNPEHLEAVTLKENILRGTSPIARLSERTHCKNNHPWSAENTVYYANAKGKPTRHCRQCLVIWRVRTLAKKKEDRANAQVTAV